MSKVVSIEVARAQRISGNTMAGTDQAAGSSKKTTPPLFGDHVQRSEKPSPLAQEIGKKGGPLLPRILGESQGLGFSKEEKLRFNVMDAFLKLIAESSTPDSGNSTPQSSKKLS